MVQNFINFITGRQLPQDEMSIREINRMEIERERIMLERQLTQIANRMIHHV